MLGVYYVQVTLPVPLHLDFHMKARLIILFILGALYGCASDYYGYTKEEWESLTPQQRDEAKANIKRMQEHQKNRDRSNKAIDEILGTTSNKY